SFGSTAIFGFFFATYPPQDRSIRTTCTRRLANVAKVLSGEMIGWTGSYIPTSIRRAASAWSGWAEAATIDSMITSRAMLSFLDPKWLPSEGWQHAPQTLFELDLRFPAQHVPGSGDLGLTSRGVVDWLCFDHDLTRCRCGLDEGLRQLQVRVLAR